MEIVTTAFNYDLDWLDKTNLPITLVRMNGCNEIRLPAKFSVIDAINKGREAAAYLRFIINRYDSLPDRVVFIHGHENASHQLAGDLVYLINNAPDEDFIGLNGNIRRLYLDWNPPWRKFKTRERAQIILGYDPGNCLLVFDGNAQFIVKSSLILKWPIEHYQKLLDMVLNSDDSIAYAFEELWYLFFTGRTEYIPIGKYFIDKGLCDPRCWI